MRKEQGPSFVIHKNKGRKPANALSDELVARVLALRKEKYFEVMRSVIDNYGLPLCLYSDRRTIFVSPNRDKLSLEDQLQGKVVSSIIRVLP